MSTKPRYCVVGTPHHVYQRGVDRKEIFFSKHLRRTYLSLMEKYAREACVQVHAYVLMGNHVHLLLTAMKANGISTFMQNLNSVYVSKVNKIMGRDGVLFSTRLANYRKLVNSPMADKLIEQIRWRTWLGYPIGSEQFLDLLEEITGLPSHPRRCGRRSRAKVHEPEGQG